MNVAFNIDYFVSLEDIEIPHREVLPMGYSFILDQLAQGSAPPPDLKLPFDVLVLAAMEYQPAQTMFPGITLIHVPLDDAIPKRDEVLRAIYAGKQVAAHVQRGDRVLTTCFMGKNRSGLVNGFALMELGYSSQDAITLIKNARGDGALGNMHFVNELHARGRGRARQVALV
jgi:protein-tyrosine phosphatase